MKKLIVRITVAVSLTFSVIGGSVEAWAQVDRRVALVVGNADYKAAGISLSNPRNDAEDISTMLRGLGFKVITKVNLTKRDMDLALQEFARESVNADAALFFYAGHAMQYQGRNFLMPTDAELQDDISVRFQTISLEDVNAAFERVGGVKILILDACRNNLLSDRLQKTTSRGVGATTRGLARIDKTEGMVVAYATGAGDTAADGTGRNSPFTTSLLKRMQEPGIEIEMMFRRVASDVTKETGGKQHPEHTVSLLSEYYLNRNDQVLWEKTDKDSAAALRQFLDKYPSSPQAVYARNKLELLERLAKEREEARAREEEQRVAEEQRRRDEETKRKLAEAEQKRKLAEAEEQKRKLAEAEQQKRKLAEAEEQKRKLAEADEQKRKLAEADEQKRRLAEADEQKRKLAEVERKLADSEARRKDTERQQVAALEIKQQEERKREDAARQQQLQVDVERKRIEDTCHREEAKLTDLKNAGALAREQLVKFETEAECKLLRQSIAAVLAALPPAVPVAPPVQQDPDVPPVVKVNQPEQIKQAQIELKRLGCFTGNPDGALMLNEKTRSAVKDFLIKTHKPVVEVSITDEFIADLKQQSTDFCIPPKAPVVKQPVPTAEHHSPAPSHKEAAGRQQAEKPALHADKPAQPQTPSTPTKSFGIGMGM